jgi:branched-chain amino acid transport system substrate-binding protein
MQRAGDKCNNRSKVIDEVFSTKNKQGVTGTYDIDKDGDVTLHQFGRHVIINGALSPVKTVIVKEDSNGKPLL